MLHGARPPGGAWGEGPSNVISLSNRGWQNRKILFRKKKREGAGGGPQVMLSIQKLIPTALGVLAQHLWGALTPGNVP